MGLPFLKPCMSLTFRKEKTAQPAKRSLESHKYDKQDD
jgi:hypothetical protein